MFRYAKPAMSEAKATLVRFCRCVAPEAFQGVKPSPLYFPIAQIRPLARSVRAGSGVGSL